MKVLKDTLMPNRRFFAGHVDEELIRLTEIVGKSQPPLYRDGGVANLQRSLDRTVLDRPGTTSHRGRPTSRSCSNGVRAEVARRRWRAMRGADGRGRGKFQAECTAPASRNRLPHLPESVGMRCPVWRSLSPMPAPNSTSVWSRSRPSRSEYDFSRVSRPLNFSMCHKLILYRSSRFALAEVAEIVRKIVMILLDAQEVEDHPAVVVAQHVGYAARGVGPQGQGNDVQH